MSSEFSIDKTAESIMSLMNRVQKQNLRQEILDLLLSLQNIESFFAFEKCRTQLLVYSSKQMTKELTAYLDLALYKLCLEQILSGQVLDNRNEILKAIENFSDVQLKKDVEELLSLDRLPMLRKSILKYENLSVASRVSLLSYAKKEIRILEEELLVQDTNSNSESTIVSIINSEVDKGCNTSINKEEETKSSETGILTYILIIVAVVSMVLLVLFPFPIFLFMALLLFVFQKATR